MAGFTLATTLDRPYDEAVAAVRTALAYEALTAEPSIAAVLPCNVVVRAVDETTTVVEAFDPDARQRLTAALTALDAREGPS